MVGTPKGFLFLLSSPCQGRELPLIGARGGVWGREEGKYALNIYSCQAPPEHSVHEKLGMRLALLAEARAPGEGSGLEPGALGSS